MLGFIGYYRASIRDLSRKGKTSLWFIKYPRHDQSKQKTFQKNKKVKNHPVNQLIGQTNTKVFLKIW